MYRIGEFSKITQLSIKTLRYYDEIAILSPSMRDEATHYRYYNEADFQKAQMIQLLRRFDFSMMEIKDILEGLHTKEDLSYYIQEKQEFIRQEIKAKEALLKQMDLLLEPQSQKSLCQTYEVKRIKMPEMLVASYRYRGNYQEMSKYLSKMYQEIKGASSNQPPFNLYYDEAFEEQAEIEICIPIKKHFSASFCTIQTLPEIAGISTIHQGSYASLTLAYKVLLDDAIQHQYHLMIPSREVYLKGPGKIFKGNPNTYRTQIILPIQEEGSYDKF